MRHVISAVVVAAMVFNAHVALASTTTTLLSLENARQLAAGSKAVEATRVCTKEHYALVGFEDANVAGTSLYHEIGHKWTFVMGGGGRMNSGVLVSYHVPAKTAAALALDFPALYDPATAKLSC